MQYWCKFPGGGTGQGFPARPLGKRPTALSRGLNFPWGTEYSLEDTLCAIVRALCSFPLTTQMAGLINVLIIQGGAIYRELSTSTVICIQSLGVRNTEEEK